MKKLILVTLKRLVAFFVVFTLVISCEKEDTEITNQEHQIAKVNHLHINELPDVENALNQISSSRNGRMMQTSFGALNLSDILEFVNSDGKETYSFLIDKEIDSVNTNTFENLHLVKIPQGFLGYILKWEPSEAWLEENNYNFDLQYFTGTQKHYDLEYNLIQENTFVNGSVIDNSNGKNSNNRRDMALVCIETTYSLCSGSPWDCGGSICGFGMSIDCSLVYVSGGGGDSSNGNSSGGGGSIIGTGNEDDTETDHHDSTSDAVVGGDAIVVPVLSDDLDKKKALSLELNDLLGNNDSFEFDDSIADEETLNFDSVDDFANFLDGLEDSFELVDTETVDEHDGTKVTKFKGKLDMLLVPVYLNVHATSTLDDVFTPISNEFVLEELISFESGIAPFLDWEQDSYEYTLVDNIVTVTIHGHFNIGISIWDIDIDYTDSFIVTVIYNSQTGNAIDMDLENDD